MPNVETDRAPPRGDHCGLTQKAGHNRLWDCSATYPWHHGTRLCDPAADRPPTGRRRLED